MVKWIWSVTLSLLFISSAFAIDNKIALNMSGYMSQIHQRVAQTVAANTSTQKNVHTEDYSDIKIDTTANTQFNSMIKNPTIAYLLILIAIYAIFFELKTPGTIIPGLLGVFALGIALYSFHLIHINNLGLTLLLLGICFMVIEVSARGFGFMGISGLLSFVVGSSILYTLNEYTYHLSFGLILAMSVITVAFFIMVTTLGIKKKPKRVHRSK